MKILIVEDEKKTGEYLTKGLTEAGFVVDLADNGLNGYHLAMTSDYDLLILDIMLPDVNGWDIVRMLRAAGKGMPILLLTALGTIEHRVKGLELGADDYMIKPFDSKELVARVKAVLRRYQLPVQMPASSVTEQHGNFVEYPDLIVNLTNYSVIYNGHSIELPPKELELLYFLASSPNQVFTREQLLDHIWGYEYIGDTRTVDVHIKRLREKIKGNDKWALTTVWGIGYKFEVKR
mgnify:CR=1 FL=1